MDNLSILPQVALRALRRDLFVVWKSQTQRVIEHLERNEKMAGRSGKLLLLKLEDASTIAKLGRV